MKTKRLFALTLCFATLTVILLVALLLALRRPVSPLPQETDTSAVETDTPQTAPPPSSDTEATQPPSPPYCRTLRAYGDKLAVFDEEGKIVQIIEVYMKTLPQADQLLLREGISVSSEQELLSLIEDYTE